MQQPSRASRRLETEVLDEDGAHIFASHPERSGHVTPVDERSFAIIFFDKELLEFAAPYEQHREIWRTADRATARRPSRRSSVPAPGRSWR